MRITLTVVEGPEPGRVFSFEEHSTFLVGPSPDAHFVMPADDPYFSRLHFLVELNPPLCRLTDLGSRNGTFVNGRRVETNDLKDGDQIRAGHTVLRVAVERTADPHPEAATRSWQPEVASPSVPGYTVVRELGQGGMGIVYEAVRTTDGVRVALKTIRPAATPTHDAVERFLREARTLRALNHPHIVAFRDMGETEGLLYFVMELVEGVDASRLLQAEGPLSVPRAIRLVGQLLDALAYAHGEGFVHRDVKPANLLVSKEDSREVARLADFGLARTYQASQLSGLTMAGVAGGTPLYLPPEQVIDFRTARPAADQYSAAATLYTLLTGRTVYDPAPSAQKALMRVLNEEPVPVRTRRPDLTVGLAVVIHRALSRRPEDRYSDVTAFQNALRPFLAE